MESFIKRTRPNKNEEVTKTFQENTTADFYREPYHSMTIDCIQVAYKGRHIDDILMSLGSILEYFKDGLILFDNGKIYVIFKFHFDLKVRTANLADIKSDHGTFNNEDCYATYKKFVMFNNSRGNVEVLPSNGKSSSEFGQLKKIIQRNESSNSIPTVKLADILRPSQTEIFHTELSKEDQSTDRESVSLSKSSEKRKVSSRKVLIFNCHSKHQIEKLPTPIPLERIGLSYPYNEISNLPELKFPEQVSEEERFEYQRHSEQVISSDRTGILGDINRYGLSSRNENASGLSHLSNATLVTSASTGIRPVVSSAKYPVYADYANRLISYHQNWPHTNPDPAKLSQGGFFYTDTVDLVRCFQCGIGLKDFSADDDPVLEHVRHSPTCPFLVELLQDQLCAYKSHLAASDPEYNSRQQWNGRHNRQTSTAIRNPDYQTKEARLMSFTNWPSQLLQTPQQLADAGLYYTGIEDHVRCFACNGGLRSWDADDDPWTEHCRWFPACPYAIQQKGEQFIALIQAASVGGGEATGGMDILPREMQQLRLREAEIEHLTLEHRELCREMGYKDEDLKQAVKELKERGTGKPRLEEILDLIEIIRERNESADQDTASRVHEESLIEENKRLKRLVYCLKCGKNTVNALFLPCTHHEVCMNCAENLKECPVCHRQIKEKIRTYMS